MVPTPCQLPNVPSILQQPPPSVLPPQQHPHLHPHHPHPGYLHPAVQHRPPFRMPPHRLHHPPPSIDPFCAPDTTHFATPQPPQQPLPECPPFAPPPAPPQTPDFPPGFPSLGFARRFASPPGRRPLPAFMDPPGSFLPRVGHGGQGGSRMPGSGQPRMPLMQFKNQSGGGGSAALFGAEHLAQGAAPPAAMFSPAMTSPGGQHQPHLTQPPGPERSRLLEDYRYVISTPHLSFGACVYIHYNYVIVNAP